MRAYRSRIRKFAAMGLLVTGALFATACQPSDADASGPDSSSSAPSAPGGGSSDGGSSDGGDAPAGKPVNGTFSGELRYLAPGKHTVGNQGFYVADDTKITGAGGICDANTACTPDQLDTVLKNGDDIMATVVIKSGMATSITEYTADGSTGGETGGDEGPEESRSVTGTFSGELAYLAPGKHTVQNQGFFVADDTKITGAGRICDANTACTPDQLDTVLKDENGIMATVVIKDGIATSIDEYDAE
ncbi:hypothetical protein ACWDSL_45870 [Streptomyces sp. NPDC000941]